MRNKVIRLLLLTCCLAGTSGLHAQDFRIKNYGVREGLLHPFAYSIHQDKKGYIWIGTGEGLCRFNGQEFSAQKIADSLAGEIAGISWRDTSGTLWFGFRNGDVATYDGKRFKSVPLGMEINGAVTGIIPSGKDAILIATLNTGLLKYLPASATTARVKGIEESMITSMALVKNQLLIGSPDGLSVYSYPEEGPLQLKFKVSELDFVKIQDIRPSSHGLNCWIATEDQGLFRLTITDKGYVAEKFTQLPANENIQSLFEDSRGNIWASTLRSGLYMIAAPDSSGGMARLARYNKSTGLAGDAVKNVFEDREGNMWVATYGDGISLLTVQTFTFYSFLQPDIDNDISSVAVADGRLVYVGGAEGLYAADRHLSTPPVRIGGLPADRITALALHRGSLLIGTEGNGLYRLHKGSQQAGKVAYESNSMGSSVTSIASDEEKVYIGTLEGVFVFDGNLGLTAHYTTSEGMPHNRVEQVILDSKNRLLIATKTNGIYSIDGNGDVVNLYPAGNVEIEFRSVTEDDQGNLWAATYGEGVVLFEKDSVYQFTTSEGLKSNFCYGIKAGRGNTIWVGHRLGISRINGQNRRISVFDLNMGMTGDCNINSMFRDGNDVMYFGTTEGLIAYDPAKERKGKLPPLANITRLLISDREYDPDTEIVLPYKVYRLRIDFVGLNFSDPQSVRYQYMLEGYDMEWSDVTSQTSVSYPRIEDGTYVFKLRAFDSEGLAEEIPLAVRIRVKLPLWKKWWFISLLVIALIGVIYLYIKFRERKQKQLQEYLERELTARTREVVEKKEEIEIKNRDITDSINYAKRIQTSMLPSVKRLQEHFSGCFVFYSPRDIVSGDFYWFDQVANNKFMIVCADSTGHGVPGAFMSMIGSTLIKDICTRDQNNSPSRVLQVLDLELRNTLNQNLEDGSKPVDGMDIIVCEIDLKTHYVRYASAMRPMVIYKNSEEFFVKGSRNSVGGHYDKEDNLFEDEGIQLSKGDIIYMFSDGYSDQFGGPMGKKFKMVRLKNLLQDIHQKPMDEQFVHVKNTFNLWKENYEQVDDVLFMGIKI